MQNQVSEEIPLALGSGAGDHGIGEDREADSFKKPGIGMWSVRRRCHGLVQWAESVNGITGSMGFNLN
jgi:hypothetical protein